MKEEKKKSKKGLLIIILVIILICVGVIFLVPGVKDKIPVIGDGLSQKWAQKYYEWIISKKKDEDDEIFDGVATSKIYFIGLKEHPIMIIEATKDGKTNNIFAYQQQQDYKPSGGESNDVRLYYDSVYDEIEYFDCWRAEFNNEKYTNCQHLTKYHNVGESRKPDFFFYDNGTFEIHDVDNLQKKANTKKDQILVEIDYKQEKYDFDITGTDADIKKALKKAADNFVSLDDMNTDEMKTEAKKKIEENNKKAEEEAKKKANSSSSSSSSSSNIGQGTNPCDVIERKKCPSGFQLICSMEWCEKKEYVNKSECNDDLAKKYGTPVAGQTEWSSYYNACIINIEATK